MTKQTLLILSLLTMQVAGLATTSDRFYCLRGDEWTIELDTNLGRAALFDNDSWTYFVLKSCGGESLDPTCVYVGENKKERSIISFQMDRHTGNVVSLNRTERNMEDDNYQCSPTTGEFGNGEF